MVKECISKQTSSSILLLSFVLFIAIIQNLRHLESPHTPPNTSALTLQQLLLVNINISKEDVSDRKEENGAEGNKVTPVWSVTSQAPSGPAWVQGPLQAHVSRAGVARQDDCTCLMSCL